MGDRVRSLLDLIQDRNILIDQQKKLKKSRKKLDKFGYYFSFTLLFAAFIFNNFGDVVNYAFGMVNDGQRGRLFLESLLTYPRVITLVLITWVHIIAYKLIRKIKYDSVMEDMARDLRTLDAQIAADSGGLGIPKAYQNEDALSSFVEYIRNRRALGIEKCISIFEEDRKHKMVIKKLDEIKGRK
jgi:hypothetical protein